MSEIKIKPKKEINSALIIRIICCFLLAFLSLLAIYNMTSTLSGGQQSFTFRHVIIFALCAIPLSVLYALTVEKLGSGLGGILTGWTKRKIPPREQLSADLSRAKHDKGKGQFKEALIIINEVLEKDPKFPDALLLKAQIMWEGFENSELALRSLDEVIALVQDDDPIYSWAVNYYHEVKKAQRIEN